jgi:alkaline phosphatase D
MNFSNARRRLLQAGLAASSGTVRAGGQERAFRIAFGSCAKQSKPQPIWAAIEAQHPDLFIFLGDNLYIDSHDPDVFRAKYREFEQLESVQRFRARVPHIATWDDHDFGDDDAGGDYALKQLSQQLFCDTWHEPADSPRRTRDGIYTSYRYSVQGRSVQVILLDLRFNRSPLLARADRKDGYEAMVRAAIAKGEPAPGWYLPNPDRRATLLGEPQWRWLEQQLSEPADFRIIGSSIQFCAEGTGWEAWSNFPLERERFVGLVAKTGASGLFVISGDMHYGEISRLDVPGRKAIWDITSSGLTETWAVPTPNARRVAGVYARQNFGMIEIDPSQAGNAVRLMVCDLDGAIQLQQALSLDELGVRA